jgi:uncharacterized heparinase superfamily protein
VVARIRLRTDAELICDVAPVGPDYLPGHAHADTLSFELSIDGKRVLVNTGTSTYEAGPERFRERSTMAHNTVEVDGADSSEVWSAFRVARRARPFNVTVTDRGEELQLDAQHDGYRRLKGNVMHRRTWRLRDTALSIEDTLTGSFSNARVLLHLHPLVDADSLALSFQPAAEPKVSPWMWAPEFGRTEESSMIDVAMTSDRLVTRIAW